MIIGITGRIGAGKDTLAQIILNQRPEYEIQKFAGPLRDVARVIIGDVPMDTQQDKAAHVPALDMTVREVLQRVGTDAIRNGLHPDAWVHALMRQYVPGQSKWIITDVRFPNEVKAIIACGGVVFRIVRTNNPFPPSDHPSESALDNIRLPIVWNTNDIHELAHSYPVEALEYLSGAKL